MEDRTQQRVDRRTVLAGLGSGAIGSIAGCSLFEAEDDANVSPVEEERAAAMAERFAPTVYFDDNEQWFPTDPRRYQSGQNGDTVVEGFDALNGYVEAGDGATDPTVFYHVLEYDTSPLAVVQYWFYTVFDQFTTNFHWHDWELLQVFVDTDTDEVQLHVASAHSRSVPNNEFLDPEPIRPRVLSELGSHSSGLSVNEDREQFQRLPIGGDVADITNSVIEGIDAIEAIPLAYGLPRDEGFSLPFTVPELDGAPIYDHDRLPSVTAADFLPEKVTIRSFTELQSPPELPPRETGYRFDHRDAQEAGTDVAYDLAPSGELEHIDRFTGPQLSFEFAIPAFVENAIADHITTAGVPWKQPRYENPGADISEAKHRQALADRYDAIGEPSPISQVVAGVTNAVSNENAPDGEGVTTIATHLEMVALFQSEPAAVPTFNGIAVIQDVPAGDHELTINGAGVEPHSETVPVGETDDVTAAGVGGEIPVVARENAIKLGIDPSDADSNLRALAIEDDFAGRLYEAPLSGPDAVYIHEGGAYTTEVRDEADEIGAFRVNPGDEARIEIANPRTGKAPLAAYVADVATETSDLVSTAKGDADPDDTDDDTDTGGNGGQSNAVDGLVMALDAVATAAGRAAENAEAGNRENANQQLATVSTRLDRVSSQLSAARESLPIAVGRAVDRRLEQTRRRNEQAQNAGKL